MWLASDEETSEEEDDEEAENSELDMELDHHDEP